MAKKPSKRRRILAAFAVVLLGATAVGGYHIKIAMDEMTLSFCRTYHPETPRCQAMILEAEGAR